MDHADGVRLARGQWKNNGQQRPPFAIEPRGGQESVWDYPRPPAIVQDNREVIVRFDEIIIARTTRSLRICESDNILPATYRRRPKFPQAIQEQHILRVERTGNILVTGDTRTGSTR